MPSGGESSDERRKEMKGIFKKTIAAGVAAATLVSMASCGGTVINSERKDRTTINVQVFQGGTGADWMKGLAENWNSKNDKYAINVVPKDISSSSVITDVGTGVPGADAYFVTTPCFQTAYYGNNDYFEDLTDILNTTPDGETRTIGDKMINKENWLKMASKNGQGCYLLPYADSMLGFVFNYDTFAKQGWLLSAEDSDEVKSALTAQGITYSEGKYNGKNALVFESSTTETNYEKGDVIMRAGRDGKYGTYDDGQPISFAEWTTMIEDICADGYSPFSITGKFLTYITPVVYALMAQYGGINDYNTYFSFDSGNAEIKLHDGTTSAINVDNGNKVFGAESLYKAIEFVNTYFNDTKYVHASSYDETSQYDAQDKYLMSEADLLKGQKKIAMLVEGTWWEREASSRFATIAARPGKEDFKYGTRDYRFMLFPDLIGQAETEKSDIATLDSGSFVIAKSSDREKVAALKDFIVYTLSDEGLRHYTVQTGCVRPFEYSLTETDKAEMTVFAKNNFALYHDTENVRVLRAFVDKYASPMTFASEFPSLSSQEFSCNIDGVPLANVIDCLRKYGLQKTFEGIASNYDDSWAGYLSQARASGFYKTK